MKTILNKLLKGRITRWGFLAVLLIGAGATVGWMNQRCYQLGGSFVGGVQGIQWIEIETPLDLYGQKATLQIQFPTWPAELQAALLTPFGADTLSVGAGEMAMTDRDTAKFTWVAYAVTDAHPQVIKAIWLVNGTREITGPNSAMSAETLRIYAPEADGNHDGLPDSTAMPLATVPFPPGLSVRVPILP
ncbi:MAG: hypothetical protein HY298_07980 [Verrucomicrobia bacterium]|nr:hypothetical protein [Verrucomicrobiota bacterium]